MLDRLSRFYRLNTGYEKTLRLIQALCLVALEIGSLDSITAKRVSAAKSQLALIRRCIRFWNFLDCFNRVSSLLGQDAPNPRKKSHAAAAAASPTGFLWWLEVAKWSCFGVYFLLEDLTLLHAAEIYPVSWAKPVTVEAFKFWYYALALSLIGTGWEWYSGVGAGSVGKGVKTVGGKRGGAGAGKAKGRAGATAGRVDTSTLLKRVVVDGCDLLIPGTYLRWMGGGPLGVGVGMVVSTAVSLREIWRSV